MFLCACKLQMYSCCIAVTVHIACCSSAKQCCICNIISLVCFQEQLQSSPGLVISVEGIDPRWHTHRSGLPLFVATTDLMITFHDKGVRYSHQVQSLEVMLWPSNNSMLSPPHMRLAMLTLQGNIRLAWNYMHAQSCQCDSPALPYQQTTVAGCC